MPAANLLCDFGQIAVPLCVCLSNCKLGIKSLVLAILPGLPEESLGSSLWMCFTQAHVWERLVPKTARHWSCGGGLVLGRIHNPVQLLTEQEGAEAQREPQGES